MTTQKLRIRYRWHYAISTLIMVGAFTISYLAGAWQPWKFDHRPTFWIACVILPFGGWPVVWIAHAQERRYYMFWPTCRRCGGKMISAKVQVDKRPGRTLRYFRCDCRNKIT